MRNLILAAAAATTLAACTTPEERAETRAENKAAASLSSDGKTYGDGAVLAGAPTSCVQITRIRQSLVKSDDVIDFEMNGGPDYRVVLPNSCPSLGFEKRFAYKTSLSQLCSTDIITVLQSPGISQGASCGLGQFQPIEKAPR